MTVKYLGLTLLLALSMSWASAAESAAGPAATPTSTATAVPSNAQFHILPVDDAWRANLPRNADAATQAYMDRLPPDVIARSNAYFEGGYWLQLWNFLLGLAISLLILGGQRSARVRNWAQRVGRKAFLLSLIHI